MQKLYSMKAATQMPIQQVIGKERISRSFPIITAKAVSLKRIEKLVKTKSGQQDRIQSEDKVRGNRASDDFYF